MASVHLDDTLRDLDDLSRYRAFVNDELTSVGLDEDTIDDTVLILSELLTNAFTHGQAREVYVHISADQDCAELSVSHPLAAAAHLPTAPTSMPASSDRAGRGLPIVDSLAVGRETTVTDDQVRVSCRVLRDPRG